MKKAVITILSALLSISSSAMTLEDELNSGFSNANSMIQNKVNTRSCSIELEFLNQEFSDIKSVNWTHFQDSTKAQALIKKSFLTRLNIRNKLIEMSQNKVVDQNCSDQVRETFVNLRFLEEYMAKVAKLDADVDVLKGVEPYLLINPKFGTFNLQSGDIIISRGNAIVSAAIAQIGDQVGHFSHAAMIYIDPKTNVKYAIEAHIEIGSDVLPMDESYTQDGKVRAIVYRQKDVLLAKKAAKLAYDRVLAAKNAKSPVLYNFAMDTADESKLFCSQIPYMAYKNASGGMFKLGQQYLTQFNFKDNDFLRGVGVTVKKTYSPSDVELDNQLELVAEWRDLGRAHQTHRKDAVVGTIYNWMLVDNLKFDLSKTEGEAMLVRIIRSLPLLKKIVEGSVAPNITGRGLQNMMALNYVGEKMLDDLIEDYIKFEEKNGYPMSLEDMNESLEKARKLDLVRLQDYKEWRKTNSDICSGEAGSGCADQPEKPHFMDYFK